MQRAMYPAISPGHRPTLHRPTLRKGSDVTSDLFYDECLDWNHTRTVGPRIQRRLALQRKS